MKSRRLARQAALQIVYACDALDDWSTQNVELVMQEFFSQRREEELNLAPECMEFARVLVANVCANLEVLNSRIGAASEHWTLARMSRIDRNILRIAVSEMLFMLDIPAKVSINEALEVAKRFSSDESTNFINGVLDKIASGLRPQGSVGTESRR